MVLIRKNKRNQAVISTVGNMQHASQIVRPQGGFEDPEAVLGSLRLFAQCILLSSGLPGHVASDEERPWTMVHPQTGRQLYTELKFTWAEVMEQSWAEFKNAVQNVVQNEFRAYFLSKH